jgi:NTE family protein
MSSKYFNKQVYVGFISVLVWVLCGFGSTVIAEEYLAVSTNHAATASVKKGSIGLVLGGGGAKGGAHIGVLRRLEELRIPIDYINGTSIGAIVAGLYASGMSPDEIEKFLLSIDWWDALDDRSSRRDMPFRRKHEDRRFMHGSEVGFNGGKFIMPSGLSSGQKINNMFVEVTSHVASINDFNELNIPFCCIATDLPTASSVVLSKGNLAKSIRASMAVPVVFSPVHIDDYIFIDGGLLNNIPVDVIKDMGADRVIAVDVGGAGDWHSRNEKFESIDEIMSQTSLILQRPEQDKRLALADVVISPDTSGFVSSDFHKSADIIPTGYVAVKEAEDKLTSYSVDKKIYSQYLEKQRDKTSAKVIVGDLIISGNKHTDTRAILGCINTETNEAIDYNQLEADIARIYALGNFEYVTYNLVQRDNSDLYDVEYIASEKPWGPGYFKAGIRLEADFNNRAYWAGIVNYNRRQLNALGAEWSLEAQVGSANGIYTDFYQPLTYSGRFFVSPIAEFISSRENVFIEDKFVSDYDVDRTRMGLDFGVLFGTCIELRFGYDFEFVSADVDIGSSDLPDIDNDIGALHGRFLVDTFDKSYFPTKGFMVSFTGDLVSESLGADFDYEMIELLMNGVKSLGKHTVSVRLGAGTSFGSDIPYYNQFTLGGVSSFGGLARGQLRGEYLAVGSLGYRYQIGRLPPGLGNGIYVLIRSDAGNVWQDNRDVDFGDLRYGVLAGLAADIAMGPTSLLYGAANEGGSSMYFSVGVQF